MHRNETFTPEERRLLSRHFTNCDGPVFALVNLPEVVKGALFARYSRSPKSLRRLFIDEFAEKADTDLGFEFVGADRPIGEVGTDRAERLYKRVFTEYGDDSVAQLGGAHIACEDMSNVLTKVVERGRLMSYLEQSTRYIPYGEKVDGSFRYLIPPEIRGTRFESRFVREMNALFESYAAMYSDVEDAVLESVSPSAEDTPGVFNAAVRAKVCDTLRGLLPAATRSNVGLFGSGQAFEALLFRLMSSGLAEATELAGLIHTELLKVIPSFVSRVALPDRGGRWVDYLCRTRERAQEAAELLAEGIPESGAKSTQVRLLDWAPSGERDVAAAILFELTSMSYADCVERAKRMTEEELASLIRCYVGDRQNRRHRPGRAFEATDYLFEVVSDYGAFRDLQRHRMLTIEWQPLGTLHGYTRPELVESAGLTDRWDRALSRAAAFHRELEADFPAWVAAYALPMAFRIRYTMKMNAREAMHVIELRTSPQGHPEYRYVCHEMKRRIAEVGHGLIAGAMSYAGEEVVGLERLEAERKAAERRASAEREATTSAD